MRHDDSIELARPKPLDALSCGHIEPRAGIIDDLEPACFGPLVDFGRGTDHQHRHGAAGLDDTVRHRARQRSSVPVVQHRGQPRLAVGKRSQRNHDARARGRTRAGLHGAAYATGP